MKCGSDGQERRFKIKQGSILMCDGKKFVKPTVIKGQKVQIVRRVVSCMDGRRLVFDERVSNVHWS